MCAVFDFPAALVTQPVAEQFRIHGVRMSKSVVKARLTFKGPTNASGNYALNQWDWK
jgi:hypothetical protein